MNTTILLEIACFTPESAISAYQGGADRIELCSGYSEGGLSPSAGSIRLLRQLIPIEINVMIRPRIGDFVYSDLEKEIILHEIDFCKKSGISGIVCGALSLEGKVDEVFIKQLVDRAKPMSVTFHRAFDLCSNLPEALKTLIHCKVDRVLTSGGKSNAIEGTQMISHLIQQSKDQIIILPGGGLKPSNIENFIRHTGATEVHFSAKQLKKSEYPKQYSVRLSSTIEVNDYDWYESDAQLIRQMKTLIKNDYKNL